MNHMHHGMSLGPLPIGMLANSAGAPVGIGIRLPMMAGNLPPLAHQNIPQSSANSNNNSQFQQQQQRMIVSVSPDSSEDIVRMNSVPMTMSPSHHHHPGGPNGPLAMSQQSNSNNCNNPWNSIVQQPMAGMLMNPAMMGMNGCVGVMAPQPNMNMGEPNPMLYGINLLNSSSTGLPGPPRPHHLPLPPPASNAPPPCSQQYIDLSGANNHHHDSITTTNSPSNTNGGCQPNSSASMLQHLPAGLVNGSIPTPICSTTTQQPNTMMLPAKEIIHCKSCTLFPPNPSAPPPTTREKPPGCRTVFVGGLPENGNEDLIREMFERCGEIATIRMSKKNFCHIRFELESFIENAIYLSGYRVRIGSNSDAPNIGRLHVDYAQARDDFYEWECRQRQLLREQRHRERLEQERLLPPSPPPVVHFSDHEALNLTEKLKGDQTFMKGVQVLMTWLERGDCSKKNSNTFYSMIQSTNSHVRRLLSEKATFEEELQKAKELSRQRMQGLILQFCQIEKVFVAASHKKVWDHFTKAQRKNIDVWKKQALEIKNMQLEEALNERNDEEMDLSELSESDNEDTGVPLGKRLRLDDSEQTKTLNQLKEENDALRCQLETFKHEVELIKADLKTELELKEQHVQELHEELKNYRRSPIVISSPTQSDMELQSRISSQQGNSSPKTSTAGSSKCSTLSSSSIANGSTNHSNNEAGEKCDSTQQLLMITFTGESSTNNNNGSPPNVSSTYERQDSLSSSSSSSSSTSSSPRETTSAIMTPTTDDLVHRQHQHTIRITEREARLVGIISTFLHVHPFGASLDYIWSYAQKLIPGIYPIQIEALMFKFTSLFRQELTGIGATLERKWIFIGFSNANNSNSNSNEGV